MVEQGQEFEALGGEAGFALDIAKLAGPPHQDCLGQVGSLVGRGSFAAASAEKERPLGKSKASEA